MSKFRVTPVVRGYDFFPAGFDTLAEAKAYVAANPPDSDNALDLVSGDSEFLEMHYVVEDVDAHGRAKLLGYVEDGETWIEDDVTAEV